MPENNAINIDAKTVTPADVDWIDHYGPALIHGHRFTPGDIAQFEYGRDRDHTGRLTSKAKTRIATILTDELASLTQLWQRAREAYRAERAREGTNPHETFQGPADTGASRRTPKPAERLGEVGD